MFTQQIPGDKSDSKHSTRSFLPFSSLAYASLSYSSTEAKQGFMSSRFLGLSY